MFKLENPELPSLSNYTAVAILEQLGLDAPSQYQINIMETLVLMATQPAAIDIDRIKACIGTDDLALSFLTANA